MHICWDVLNVNKCDLYYDNTRYVNTTAYGTLNAGVNQGHTHMFIDMLTKQLWSRNKRRNLWVGRCVSSWWPWFPSRSSVLIYMYIYIYICRYIPYASSVIGRIYNGSVIQYWRSCTPSRSIGKCAVPGLNATFCFLWFTNCVLLFDKNLILGCLWLLVFVLYNILILGIWCSTIPHLPGCFCPWTFFENIGFNTVLTDPFMSHLTTQLG